jgi:serine/threonine protein kinase
MIGQTLCHYRILEKLGEGGMGEVYRAEDTILGRQVALKLLPPELAQNPERLDRFKREARALAALDHPNIVTVFTVENDEAVHFLTMQLVEGKPLSQLIPRGGMPLSRLCEIAIPLADALATAHEKGVIHRDLKPANIMVSDNGRTRVLDFGLAKLRPDLDAVVDAALPTEPLTGEGQVLGTVPYMSPEQIEGKPLDQRTDLFSLGGILYQMATGDLPFKGETSLSVVSSIIKDDPRPVDEINTDLPHHLGRIIRHCLEKDRERRFQSAKEIRNELEDLIREADSGEAWGRSGATDSRSRRRWMPWFLLASLIISLVGYSAFRLIKPTSAGSGAVSSPLAGTHSQLTFETGPEMDPSLSPDGGSFVYSGFSSGNGDIYLRRVSGGRVLNLTEDSRDQDGQPAFSPDGDRIAFRSERDGGGIFVMGAMGEDVRRLTDFGYFPSWSPSGKEVVFTTGWMRTGWTQAQNQRIWISDVASGAVREVVDQSALQPDWSPNGHRIAYWGKSTGDEAHYDIFTVSAEGGEPVPVTQDAYFDVEPAWSADGRFLYFCSRRGGAVNIWRVPIDEVTGQVLGDAVPVTSGTSSPGGLSVARDGGRLAYSSRKVTFQIESIAFDPAAGRVVGDPDTITPAGLDAIYPTVSPDGDWIAFAGRFAGPRSWAIGSIRTDGTGLRQLTDSGNVETYPAWSPDGERIAYWSRRSGSREVWLVRRDGSERQQLTNTPEKTVQPPVWSPDGRRLATAINYGSTYIFDADRPWIERQPEELPRFHATENVFFLPWSWSPDGRLLAGNAHGEREDGSQAGGIVLYSFDSGEYRQVTDFGMYPQWLADSQRVLFLAGQEGEAPARFSLLDTGTGEHREVLSSEILGIAPDTINYWPRLSHDNRAIVFTRFHSEADVWMLSSGEQE